MWPWSCVCTWNMCGHEHTGSPPEANEMACMGWWAIRCGRKCRRKYKGRDGFHLVIWMCVRFNVVKCVKAVTCKEEAVIRVMLSVETVRITLLPENCMLIWPRTASSPLDRGWWWQNSLLPQQCLCWFHMCVCVLCFTLLFFTAVFTDVLLHSLLIASLYTHTHTHRDTCTHSNGQAPCDLHVNVSGRKRHYRQLFSCTVKYNL